MQTAQVMQRAMAQSGCFAQKQIAGDLAAFAALGLSPVERLSALATLVAARTHKRHLPGPARFLQQLQELTRPVAGFAPAESGPAAEQRLDLIVTAASLLDLGFDRLAARLAEMDLDAESAKAIEAVLLSRLLAAHRPHRVRLALLAAAAALAQPDFRPGDPAPLVPVEAADVAAPADHARTGTFG